MEAEAKNSTGMSREILETRDSFRVHRAFMSMRFEALLLLWEQLDLDNRPDRDEMPEITTATGKEFLLHELHRSAAQNGGLFFIVVERTSDGDFPVFVSSDRPSAQSYAQKRLNERA
jgi:hypothetical protein